MSLHFFFVLLLATSVNAASTSNNGNNNQKVATPTDGDILADYDTKCTSTLNGGTRNCCPTSGVCQSSSCTVFGFPSSAKSNCVKQNNNKCPDVYCNYQVPNCPSLDTTGNHCYGTVACVDGSTTCDSYGNLCLEDGNSLNFKICGGCVEGSNAKADRCPSGQNCVAGSCISNSPSPDQCSYWENMWSNYTIYTSNGICSIDYALSMLTTYGCARQGSCNIIKCSSPPSSGTLSSLLANC